jgi:hypothetical protein
MELSVIERLGLLSVLPKEGSFVTLRIVNDLRKSVGFTEDEIKEFELREAEGRVTWNAAAEVPRDIAIGEKATDVIVEALKNADRQQNLNASTFALYERFVEGVSNGNQEEA